MPLLCLQYRHAARVGMHRSRKSRPYLVNLPDFLPKLTLLVVELSLGHHLLVYLALPFSLDDNGLPAGDSQLHVSDHLLLLLQ